VITQARLKELLDYDPLTGVFVWKVQRGGTAYVGSVAGRTSTDGYIEISVDGVRHGAHRLAWLYVYNKWPRKEMDHINLVKNDNSIGNLREATRAENTRNIGLPNRNTSGFKGAFFKKATGRWTAAIRYNGVQRHLGTFERREDAAAAYAEASRRLHKDFGRAA